VRQDRIASALMMSAALLAFAFFCVRSWPIVVDDAYIIFRYSRNLAAGFGLAWDPGAAPVEGYTSFLWVMIMAVPFSLHRGFNSGAVRRA
jgi:hypothetical protein